MMVTVRNFARLVFVGTALFAVTSLTEAGHRHGKSRHWGGTSGYGSAGSRGNGAFGSGGGYGSNGSGGGFGSGGSMGGYGSGGSSGGFGSGGSSGGYGSGGS